MGNSKLPKNIAQNALFPTVWYCFNGKQYVTVTILAVFLQQFEITVPPECIAAHNNTVFINIIL